LSILTNPSNGLAWVAASEANPEVALAVTAAQAVGQDQGAVAAERLLAGKWRERSHAIYSPEPEFFRGSPQ